MTLEENAPDSMLAFQVHGYIFVKNTIHADYTIDGRRLVYSWTPFPGIEVRTTIEATEEGHIRVHEINSSIECEAYDCGFAVSTDDRTKFERKLCDSADGKCAVGAEARNPEGFCRVKSLRGDGTGKLLIPDPNTNLMHSKTTIPMAAYRIRKGRQVICTEVAYFNREEV